jgi:hypothetical protein
MSRKALNKPDNAIAYVSPEGLVRGSEDSSAWLYGRIPVSGNLTRGMGPKERYEANSLLSNFFQGLSDQVTVPALRWRNMLKSQYREFHLLAGSIPVRWHPVRAQQDTRLGAWQADQYPTELTQRQFALIGVRLYSGRKRKSKSGAHRKRSLLNKLMDLLDETAYSISNNMEPDWSFEGDAQTIANIMRGAGIVPFTDMMSTERDHLVHQATTWWVSHPNSPGLPIVAESEHIHLFPSTGLAEQAKKKYDHYIPCSEWNIPGQMPATMMVARSTDYDHTDVASRDAMWIGRMLDTIGGGGCGVLAVSVRGSVEPSKVTAQVLLQNRENAMEEEANRAKKNRSSGGDLEEYRRSVNEKKTEWQHLDEPPTLYDMSIVVCVPGTEDDAATTMHSISKINFVALITEDDQTKAWQSMGMCSPLRVNYYEIQTTSTLLSGSAVGSFARGGDDTGALLGFTEANRQAVYLDTTTVQNEDRKPFFLIVGDTGSGKTMTLIFLALQWAMIPSRKRPESLTPVILIDPKQTSDFSQAVKAYGGTAISLSDDLSDGVFDPMHTMDSESSAQDTAVRMLSQILDPNGTEPAIGRALMTIIHYGQTHHAVCCGQAVKMAYDAYRAGNTDNIPKLVERIYAELTAIAEANQQFRVVYGTDPNTKPLRASQGLTLIFADKYNLMVTVDTNTQQYNPTDLSTCIKQWVLNMSVIGAGQAVQNRDGIVILDEAWMALTSGSGKTLEEWARLARSQRFFPVLASQRVKEFVNGGLSSGISRGLILALTDADTSLKGVESDAENALKLFHVSDPTGEIRQRIGLPPTRGDEKIPDWDSLHALREPDKKDDDGNIIRKGRLLRGTVGYFVDNGKAALPVTIKLPGKLLAQISTRATDVDERQRRQDMQQKSRAQALQAA